MNIITIIPARGGSKEIPGKNIINFQGMPLINHTILQALNSKYGKNVWVSSDSSKILNISSSIGANIIKRPKNISGDFASTESAIIHSINEIEKITKKILIFV